MINKRNTHQKGQNATQQKHRPSNHKNWKWSHCRTCPFFFCTCFFWDILTLGLCWKIPFKSVYHPFEKFDEVSALKFSPAKRSSAKKNIPKSVEKSIFVFEKGRETDSNWNRNCLHPKNHGISSHFKNSSAVAHWTLPYGRIWSCIAGVFLGPQNSQAIEGSKFLGLGKLCIMA